MHIGTATGFFNRVVAEKVPLNVDLLQWKFLKAGRGVANAENLAEVMRVMCKWC